jgi:hypothetical protein
VKPDCNQCHDVGGFSPSFFTIENHNTSSFPLTGAHLATPCFACHLKNEEWSFRDIGQNCNDCHGDVHEGLIAEQYYPQKACTNCHSPDAWSEVTFDHAATGFLLEGKHFSTQCINCHKPDDTVADTRRIPFSGLDKMCASCHDNVHDTQFEKDGITDCARCHGFEAWKPSAFDHDSARFVLDGAHRNLACHECHKEEVVDGSKKVLYRLERFECIDCHSR